MKFTYARTKPSKKTILILFNGHITFFYFVPVSINY